MPRIAHLALVLSLSATAVPLGAAYTVQTLSYPGATETYPQAINSAGEVAGFYTDDTGTSHGFTWTSGTFASFDYPNSSGTWFTGINQTGELCGYFHKTSGSNGITIGFTLNGTRAIPFPGPSGARATFPGGVNNAGEISGYSLAGELTSGVDSGFLTTSSTGGTITELTVPTQADTWVLGLNNNLDVVGFAGANLNNGTPLEAFEYSSSKAAFRIVNMPSMVQTRFYGINDKGGVVGYGVDSGGVIHPFVYKSGAFNAFDLPAFTTTIPQGISNGGVVVGYALTSSDTIVGFVATP